MARAQTTCDHCGQTDDHPKVHIDIITTLHYDCLSVAQKVMVGDSSPIATRIIAACVGGMHGPELLAHIESLHTIGV